MNHIRKYAKAYSAGIAVLVIGTVAGDITNVVVWLLSLANITMPAMVQTSLTNIITALAGGITVAAVPNGVENA